MILERIETGPYASNCYIIGSESSKEAIIIDPGDGAAQIVGHIQEQGLAVKHVVLTHGHPDHIGAVKEVMDATGADLLIHSADTPFLRSRPGAMGMFPRFQAPPEADRLLTDGDNVDIQGINLKVIHTPGHTPGGICLLIDDILFSGDTLFAGSIGRSDFPGGNGPQLIQSIKSRLLSLPDDTVVYPGHGPETTIGNERGWNPFLQD